MDYKRTLKFVGAMVGLLFFGAIMASLAPTGESEFNLKSSLTDEALLRVDLDLQLEVEQAAWSVIDGQIDVQKDVLEALILDQREIEANGAEIRKERKDSEARTEQLISPKSTAVVSEVTPQVEGASNVIVVENNLTSTNDFSISKLAYAIAMAETADCTTGMGVTKNNCFGIMIWPEWNNYQRTGKTFTTKDEAYTDFRRIWEESYGGFPNWDMADTWTGGHDTAIWLNTVNQYYYQ